jgi:hypothetical protein
MKTWPIISLHQVMRHLEHLERYFLAALHVEMYMLFQGEVKRNESICIELGHGGNKE